MVAPIVAAAGRAAGAGIAQKYGGKLLIALLVIVLVVPVTIVAIPTALVVFAVTNLQSMNLFCDPIYRTPSVETSSWSVAQLTAQQADAIPLIVGAATAAGGGDQGIKAALIAGFLATDMTALTASTPGDNTPLGVYARTIRGGWGNAADLVDVTIATERILLGNGTARPGIMSDPNWAEQTTGSWMATIGLSTSQPTKVADASAKAIAVMVDLGLDVTGLPTGCGAVGTVSADQVRLAQELMIAADQGRLYGHDLQQIRDIATGTSTADCGVDVRILQVLTIALQNFTRVGFSDINRRCSGVDAGTGTSSAHYANGGGHAVDIFYLDTTVDGGASESASAKLLGILDPVMPAGARAGQGECGWQDTLTASNIVPFYGDSCDHLHIDVGFTDQPLKVSAP